MVLLHSPTTFVAEVNHCDRRWIGGLARLAALVGWLLLLLGGVHAQDANTESVVVVNGVSDSTVFGVGNSVRITGTVKQGAMALGGDVIVLGGTYRADDASPLRNAKSMTIMYAGYQQELRDMMRNPTGLFSPRWTPTYLGTRLLVVLFWFIVALAFTSAMPGTISRGVARLQLTSVRVAAIGLIGAVVLFVSVLVCLWIMPEPIQVFVGLFALLLWIVASLFGRVILYAATGKWLQRKYVPFGKNSEAVALLLGTGFWVLLTSLPYVWPFMAAFILIISFGLALTARYRKTVSV